VHHLHFEDPVGVLVFIAIYSICFLLFSTLRTNCYYYLQSAASNNLLLTFQLGDLTYFYIFEIQSICGRLEQTFCVNLYTVCFLS